ncbi:hypothetical protein IU405_11210 [Polaribacter sp. BAL334]|uniref:hypothetical protein n=1 Tax=Polaribacter sp. BAL334 TaxID=1708178 RepID=UPI0018D20E37|nr:hypothetical protein [Polaribacter sp. BAL334]MBG7612814.1 hypothetical protein [Polaribacter sp. BAL334]
MLLLALSKIVAILPTSEFPSEIPRCQKRNFLYTKTLAVNKNRKLKEIIENEKIKLSMSEKFRYYRLSIIFFISAIFCLTEGIVSFPKIRPFKNRIRQATQERVQ